VGVLAFLAACEEPKDIGLSPTTPVGVLYTDTLTIGRSTILLDSVRTDRTSRLLVGRYSDPTFGSVTARAFAQVSLRGTSFKLEPNYVYDSLRLVLSFRYVIGDTLRTQEVFVHRLTEDLDSTKRYTNTNSAAFSAEPLAAITYRPSSLTTTEIVVKLPDALGQELATLARGNGVSQADFRKTIKGIALVPGRNNTAVLGFGTLASSTVSDVVYNARVEMYVHEEGKTQQLYRDFPITTSASAFSEVRADRAGTPLTGLSLNRPLPPTSAGGETYIQGGTGVTTKLTFPTLESLRRQGRVAINRAELTITPKSNVPGGQLPAFLVLGEVDGNNRLTYRTAAGVRIPYLVQSEAATFIQGTSAFEAPQIAFYNSRTRSYTFQFSTYLQAVLTGFRPNGGLVVLPFSTSSATGSQALTYMHNQLNSLVLTNSSVKMVVFYTQTP